MCGAMEANPFEQPYWNLDQYLIWLASRDPAAVLRATDRPNSGTTEPGATVELPTVTVTPSEETPVVSGGTTTAETTPAEAPTETAQVEGASKGTEPTEEGMPATTPPIGWCEHQKSNVDRQKVEMEALRAIKGGRIKARLGRPRGRGARKKRIKQWFTPPKWFADLVIEFEGEPTFAAVLIRSTKDGGREKFRPRFDPEQIAKLYPPPTPSNIRDKPDVENPVVGPFIAYYDALYWLAERISLRESLPIDEAGSRAEKTIRYICMNTPEKLTMWGFRRADPDAELKPVTPQAWQGLSINPVAGQPETDLKALGRRREYGAATKGEYGPKIWTGLCFDRKQFVGASVTGGGNGPPTHTPAARPTQPGERTPRKQPLRERAQRALDELYPNGVPDQVSVSDAELFSAVNALIKKRGQKGLSHDTILRAAGRRK
jgi:hypothetical protein